MSDSGTLEFGMLGPLEVRREGVPIALGGAKPRALLGLLLLDANRVVSTDRLIDALWSESPPATAQTTLQVYVMQLRRLFEPDHAKGAAYEVLVTTPPGYVLRVRPDRFDLARFERLAERGAAALASDPAAAATTLREALDLWRGAALADLAFEPFAQGPAARLEEMRLAALEKRIEADLACGRSAELVGELQELCREHPLREAFAAHLMLALYRSGRQAEALDAYQQARRTLVDELGIDPGLALQHLERDILLQDPSLELAATPSRLPTGTVTLVFTDIEDSTELLHRLGDGYATLLVDYRRLVREAFTARGGREVDRQGDGLFFSFADCVGAAAAAVDCQRTVAEHAWPGGESVRVRIGLHTGSPTAIDGGYVGLDVHRAARIGAAAHGGQIVVSREAADVLRAEERAELETHRLGSFELKGLPEPEQLFQLVGPGSRAAEFPPPRVGTSAGVIRPPQRAVLVALGADDPDGVVALAAQLASGPRSHEVVLARLVDPAEAGVLADVTTALGAQRVALDEAGIAARLAVFTSSDVVADVGRLAARSDTDLLLVAASGATLADGTIDATLGGLLREVLCDVAFLVGRVSGEAWLEGPVLVPFGAGAHDWAALELGAWLAGAAGRPLHLLGTVAETETGMRDASRLLADAGLLIQRASGVSPVPRLVAPGRDGPVEAASEGGLLVIGLSDQWADEGLGMTRWAIARTAAVPVLFVRKGLRPGGLAPDGSVTRFAWSVTIGA